jgi:hypothetical protein
MADSDDDDLTFSKEYRETEENMLLPAKEADFRTFLADSGGAEEIVRLLVGLAESSDPPADPIAFLRAKFDAQELPEMVSGKARENIPELLAENEALHARAAELTAQLDEAVGKIEASEAAAHSGLIEGLLGGGAVASETLEGALDVAKLYAAVSAQFPAPAEPAEGEEPPPPFPWATEGAASPAGTATSDSLRAWAKDAFGYGAALIGAHEGLSLQLVVSAAGGEEGLELDAAKATGLYEACLLLNGYTEEAKEPPPADEE